MLHAILTFLNSTISQSLRFLITSLYLHTISVPNILTFLKRPLTKTFTKWPQSYLIQSFLTNKIRQFLQGRTMSMESISKLHFFLFLKGRRIKTLNGSLFSITYQRTIKLFTHFLMKHTFQKIANEHC